MNLRGNPARRENRPIAERNRSLEKKQPRRVDRSIAARVVMVSSARPVRARLCFHRQQHASNRSRDDRS
nr:hypothetical protein [Caldimonas sp.]